MIKFITKGFTKEVGLPQYGKQDIGISPYGAMDLFSYNSARKLLGDRDNVTTYEFMISPPEIEFTEDASFVISGAHRDTLIGNDIPLNRNTVIHAYKGDVVKFGKLHKGFRNYISVVKGHDVPKGLKRKAFAEYEWPDEDGYIRVVAGPEFDVLENPDEFFNHWAVGAHDDMGMRLNGKPLSQKPISMVSGPVADGTIQLTPTGPIVLLKNRQTVGGYPRVLNVISADVDLLGQYHQNNILRFKLVSMQKAEQIAITKALETS